jgi:hypothetical protein
MSCSRHSSAIVFGPRNDASTSSVFCCALNFRYVRFSLNVLSISLSGPSSDASRTEPRRLRRLAHHHKERSKPVNSGTGPCHSPELSRNTRTISLARCHIGETASRACADLLLLVDPQLISN